MTNHKPLDYQDSLAYMRDKFVPFSEANVSIASSPVLYGLSLYSVFNVIWSEESGHLLVYRLRDHYDRLVNASRILDFKDFAQHYSYPQFTDIVTGLLQKNHIREDTLVRVTVFVDELVAGTRVYGLKTAMSMYAYPMGEILPRGGVHACVSSWTRVGDNMIPPRAKVNGSYVNATLMKNEALRNGYDEAISLDTNGHVAEGTVANLFLVRRGTLVSPGNDTDILEGITRDSILQLADYLGLPHVERAVDRTELYLADEAFMVGSSARVTPVLSIDKRPVGAGRPGPITKQLGAAYREVQEDRNPHFSSWTTPIKLTP